MSFRNTWEKSERRSYIYASQDSMKSQEIKKSWRNLYIIKWRSIIPEIDGDKKKFKLPPLSMTWMNLVDFSSILLKLFFEHDTHSTSTCRSPLSFEKFNKCCALMAGHLEYTTAKCSYRRSKSISCSASDRSFVRRKSRGSSHWICHDILEIASIQPFYSFSSQLKVFFKLDSHSSLLQLPYKICQKKQ